MRVQGPELIAARLRPDPTRLLRRPGRTRALAVADIEALLQLDAPIGIGVPLTQEELAGWVGATREAVSKALRSLRSRGWIETGRRAVIIHDLAALRRRSS